MKSPLLEPMLGTLFLHFLFNYTTHPSMRNPSRIRQCLKISTKRHIHLYTSQFNFMLENNTFRIENRLKFLHSTSSCPLIWLKTTAQTPLPSVRYMVETKQNINNNNIVFLILLKILFYFSLDISCSENRHDQFLSSKILLILIQNICPI